MFHVGQNNLVVINCFFSKEIFKAIVTQTKLGNIFLPNRSQENRNPYTKQKHLRISLLKKRKKLFGKSALNNKLF